MAAGSAPQDVGGAPDLLGVPVPGGAASTAISGVVGGDGGADGATGGGSVPDAGTLAEWELGIDALQNVLENTGRYNVHEFRRALEGLDAGVYASLSYYERWAIAVSRLVVEKRLVAQSDLDAAFGPPEEQQASPEGSRPAFAVGDRVRVRTADTATRWARPHLRTPGYLFGRPGKVVSVIGLEENPERSALGPPAPREDGAEQEPPHRQSRPRQHMYRVAFRMQDVWSAPAALPASARDDEVVTEIFEHWLEEEEASSAAESASAAASAAGDDDHQHDHGHDHGHHHHHDGGEEDHVHEDRLTVEQTAADREGKPRPAQRLAEVMARVLVERGVVTREQIAAERAARDAYSRSDLGARIVVRCWTDPAFRDALVRDANAAIEEAFDVSDLGAKLIAVLNTPEVHNLVVCTLCSCYPVRILGRSPSWYKSREYRARAVAEPRAVLAEFGCPVAEGAAVRVHDSTSDLRFIVIPQRPEGSQDWDTAALLAAVTRDGMVGVARV